MGLDLLLASTPSPAAGNGGGFDLFSLLLWPFKWIVEAILEGLGPGSGRQQGGRQREVGSGSQNHILVSPKRKAPSQSLDGMFLSWCLAYLARTCRPARWEKSQSKPTP